MSCLFFIISVLICSVFCDDQKLICNGKVINYEVIRDIKVSFTHMDNGLPWLPEKFDPSRKTIFIIHGFSYEHQWAFDMGKEWLKRELVNIVIVEWPTFFTEGNYMKAALLTEQVAFKISKYVANWVKLYGKKLNSDFHFVGHSLGAHVAGQAARLLKKNVVTVNRITGFDPAYPCFENKSALLRLKKTDAEFVDVYHTNSGPGENKGNLGIYDLIGHVDFYLNGGNHQPECKKQSSCFDGLIDCILESIRKFITSNRLTEFLCSTLNFFLQSPAGIDTKHIVRNAIENTNFCDHGAAFKYFTESLDANNEKRLANPVSWPIEVTKNLRCENRKCNSKRCIELGINAELYKKLHIHRAFYIDTSGESIDCNS